MGNTWGSQLGFMVVLMCIYLNMYSHIVVKKWLNDLVPVDVNSSPLIMLTIDNENGLQLSFIMVTNG